MLQSVILGMLNQCPMTGYDLKKHIENSVGIFYRASYGSIYPALRKLAGLGQIAAQADNLGERSRKLYHITEAGTQAFLTWLSAPIDLMEADSARLAKIYFFDQLAPEECTRLLLEYEQNTRRYLDSLLALENRFTEGKRGEHYYKLSTLYYGICTLQETLRWCRHIRGRRPLEQLTEGENGHGH